MNDLLCGRDKSLTRDMLLVMLLSFNLYLIFMN